MTTTTDDTIAPEILPYLKELRRRLAGLPEEERVELLADLETHLEEIVSDEADGSLADRIGTPTAYADEFAASIGVEEAPESSRSMMEPISDAFHRIGDRLATERVQRLLDDLRPAWWTIRGLAIGIALTWTWFDFGNRESPTAVHLLGWITVVGVILVSIRAGRSRENSLGWKRFSTGLTVVGTVALLFAFAGMSDRLDGSYYVGHVYGEFDQFMYFEGEYYPPGEVGFTQDQFTQEQLDWMVRNRWIPPMTTTTLEHGSTP